MPRLSILLIDDDSALLLALVRALGQQYAVDTAESAAAARERWSGRHYDAVLCDVVMPGENGLDLLSSLAVEQARRVVFMTGGVTDAAMLDRLNGSGRPVLAKPFDLAAAERAIALVASV